jgi:2'-5' RNA ligase
LIVPALRLFVALELSDEARRSLADAVSWMVDFGRSIKVVSPENYHVTLKFLGSTPERRVPEIQTALELEASTMKTCELRLTGWGVFPEKGQPKVFWAGVGPAAVLQAAFERCEAAMETCGFARESREFHGHVTLAREGTSGVPEDFLHRWKSLGPITGPMGFRADKITLYESRTNAAGPVYRPLASYPVR